MKKTKGWKVFDENLKCKGYQFKVGETYKHKGKIEMCKSGFHFHENQNDLFQYNDFKYTNRICEVECFEVTTGDDKSVCGKIKIVHELSWQEVLSLVNLGKKNTGNRNTGDWNTGNQNTGDWNTGDWNTTDYSTGIFNTIEQKTPIFNGAAMVVMSKFKNTPEYEALFSSRFPLTECIYASDMTDEEKKEYPGFYVQQGYLKKRTFHEACKIWWDQMNKTNKSLILNIPGFSASIFEEVTGIKI